MKHIFASVLGLLLISNSFSQTSIPAGTVSGNWTLAGSPYNVMGDITIPNDSTLTIDLGVLVEFMGNYSMKVQGRLLAIGSVTDTIIFTIPTDSIGSFTWMGVQFDSTLSTNDSSKIMYCDISYANVYAIEARYFSKILISYNKIHNNRTGIYCNGSNMEIINNTISNNSTNIYSAGIFCRSSSPIIANNIISNNSTNDRGGGIYCLSSSNPSITGNTISNNGSNGSNNCRYGGGIYCSSSNPTITNNTISNNSASRGGGGFFCWASNPSITNNTISNDSSSYGGGIFYGNSSSPILVNNILWGNYADTNGHQVYLSDSASAPSFSYCDIQGDTTDFGIGAGSYTGSYTNNINTDPLFVSPSDSAGSGFNGLAADWSLLSCSPCINAGTTDTTGLNLPTLDVAGNPRIYNGAADTIVDIGSYEYQGEPTTFTAAITGTSYILCIGDSIASATASPAGGVAPYTYSWTLNDSIILNDSTSTLTGVPIGNYDLLIIDSIGCTGIDSVNIAAPALTQIPVSATICPGDSILLEGTYQTTAATYYDTVSSCDSVIATTLSIDSAYNIADAPASFCTGDSVSIYGTFRTSTGTYYDSLTSSAGCDSVYSTVVTENPTYSTFLPNQNICVGDSALIFGNYETSSGTYTDSLNTVFGCDSVVSTSLRLYFRIAIIFVSLSLWIY